VWDRERQSDQIGWFGQLFEDPGTLFLLENVTLEMAKFWATFNLMIFGG
jgi:hypothetical protein